jgi:hypothetical protein
MADAETTKTAALSDLARAAQSGDPAAVAHAQATSQIINGMPPGLKYTPGSQLGTYLAADSTNGQTWLVGPNGRQPIEMALDPTIGKDPDVVAHNIQGGYVATAPGQPPQVGYYVPGVGGKFSTFQAAKNALAHIRSLPKLNPAISAIPREPNFIGAN